MTIQPAPFTLHQTSHVGITVSSLPQALKFWQDLLGGNILYRRRLQMSADFNIVGIPDAEMETVMLALPDGTKIELLEYSKPEQREVYNPRPCDVGSVHVALEVVGAGELIVGARRLGWRVANEREGMVRLVRGDGSVWRAGYLFGRDGEAVEILERVGV